MTGANRQKGIKTSQIFRTQGEEDSVVQLMKEAHDAEKMRDIAKNAREVARKELASHLNEEEKSAVAARLGHVDHHMYLDDNSSKEAPDPEDHPDQIVYAPVRTIRHDDSNLGTKGKDKQHLKVGGAEASPHKKSKYSSSRRSPRSSALKTQGSTTAHSEVDAASHGLSMEQLTPFT